PIRRGKFFEEDDDCRDSESAPNEFTESNRNVGRDLMKHGHDGGVASYPRRDFIDQLAEVEARCGFQSSQRFQNVPKLISAFSRWHRHWTKSFAGRNFTGTLQRVFARGEFRNPSVYPDSVGGIAPIAGKPNLFAH